MATIQFFAGQEAAINNLAGSGIGFYGSSFGASVAVGSYQQTTYITNAAGTALGPQCDNVKWVNAASGMVNSSTSGIPLRSIPNFQATVNIRFTHDTAVKVQNAEVRCYDRTNINNGPSGVTFKAAQIIHPNVTQVNIGSGSATWSTLAGSGTVLSLTASPGAAGDFDNTASTRADTQHDYYVALSASPDSIGSKTMFGLYVSMEYLALLGFITNLLLL